MGVIALDTSTRLLAPALPQVRARRGQRSKRVRERNQRLERPDHWQPSCAIPKISLSRAADREAAIREELDPPKAHDAAEWFGCEDGFNLAAYLSHQERKLTQKALRAIRRQLRLQDREVVLEFQEVFEEQERQLTAELVEIEREWRRERASVPDIHARRRFLKDIIPSMEEQVANGAGPAIQYLLIEHQIELCELESVLYAA